MATVPLKDFQAYLNQDTNIEIIDGNASLKGKLFYKESEKDSNIKLTGKLDIVDFISENRWAGGRVASWRGLTLDDIDLKLEPDQLDIKKVTLDRLRARISIHKNGAINLDSLVKVSDAPLVSDVSDAPHAVAEEGADSFPMTIGVVQLKNAAVSFIDNTVAPRFTSRLSKLQGTIKGLSSENLARADVDISGQVDDYAKLLVTGQVNPLSENLYSDIKLSFSDYDMASLTPYTGHYIGKAIDKGRISLDLNYRVSENDLKGENKVLLDQFNLGQSVESEEAIKLPVGLAVAMLKDAKGMIDIDLPVEGNLDDPKFRMSGMIFGALRNVITKIAASPFKMLSKLAGGGDEDMDSVLFLPGGLQLLPEHNKRLETLTKALEQRPQILLEVRGQYDLAYDKAVIQQQKLLERLKAAKDVPPEQVSLDALDVAVLEKNYAELAGVEEISSLKAENSKVAEGAAENSTKVLDQVNYAAALLESLIALQAVSDDELRELARLRADSIRTHFVDVGGLDANRIFVLEAAEDKAATAQGVSAKFTLTAN